MTDTPNNTPLPEIANPPETPSGDFGAMPCSERINGNLRNFYHFWKLNGDILRCRKCNRGIVASRWDEDMIHADGCEARLQVRPWDQLRRMIPTQNTKDQEPR